MYRKYLKYTTKFLEFSFQMVGPFKNRSSFQMENVALAISYTLKKQIIFGFKMV
jgi:hypothetical protein